MSSIYQIKKLDDANYDTWCMQMACVLVHAQIWSVDEAIEEYDRQTQKEKEDDASVNQQAFLANSKGVTKNIIREFNGVCFKCGKREHIAAKCRLSEREGNSSQSEKCSLSSLQQQIFRNSIKPTGASTVVGLLIFAASDAYLRLSQNVERE
ncbi:unnamed protein product [Ceratitis capitata]|uniref:(Mediterranean fruit fly) hypothetical protein n=1 Tax=Ceratitis capitata TaxID=7213 RepID=A0A811UVI5_CERCA|nr:unnamed protein product [Ceratitis capitata]